MSFIDWLILILSIVFTVVVGASLVFYVVNMFRDSKPYQRKRTGSRRP